MTNVWKEAGILSRITTGVVTTVLVAMIFFGMKLYAGQQDRFTGRDARQMEKEILEYVDSKYTRAEVSIVQNTAILERLIRIEEKLDTHLQEH